MTGKVIDSSASAAGLLILILPFALVMVLLVKAWPLLLVLLIVGIGLRVWQHYQWQQWSKQVNPFFNQLIKENQGCLTALDLSIKGSLSAPAAQRFLDKKAEEFGAQRRVYEDKGTVYYFLTASALGSIFDESEPLLELEDDALFSQASTLSDPLLQKELGASSPDEAEFKPLGQHPSQDQDVWTESAHSTQRSPHALIQAELAKRLDVHSSTVGKRKSDPDFSQWSQSRDPEGVAWAYSPDTKEFLPLKDKPSEPWLSEL